MQATQTGGRSGKERRNHEFGRASRRHADELIADYFDAEEEVDRAQHIPIKRCSAYLNGAGEPAGEDVPVGVQLNLALDPAQRAERPGRREVVWPPAPPTDTPQRKLIDETKVKITLKPTRERSTEPEQRAIRFTPKAPSSTSTGLPFPQEWRPPLGYRTPKRASSIGGFAYGCLLGGAVAACILLCLRFLLS